MKTIEELFSDKELKNKEKAQAQLSAQRHQELVDTFKNQQPPTLLAKILVRFIEAVRNIQPIVKINPKFKVPEPKVIVNVPEIKLPDQPVPVKEEEPNKITLTHNKQDDLKSVEEVYPSGSLIWKKVKDSWIKTDKRKDK